MATKSKNRHSHVAAAFEPGRRDFLATAGLLASAGVLAETHPQTTRSDANTDLADSLKSNASTDYDVVIIGAGFAGLTAAREVSQRGLKTLVLEARNRLGGRVFTSQFAGYRVELGGNWTYWGHPYMWAELTRYGLSLEAEEGTYHAEELLWLADGKLTHGNAGQFDALYKAPFEEFCKDARTAFPRPFETSLSDAYKQFDALSLHDRLGQLQGLTQVQVDLLSGQLASACGGDYTNAGLVEMLRWWAQHHSSYGSFFDMASFHIKESSSALIEAIAADSNARIELGEVVETVNQDKNQATVRTSSGESVTARAVIVAVPVNTLTGIDFIPALTPEKMAMSTQRHAAAGVKVYMRLKGAYKKLNALAPANAPFTWIYTVHQQSDSTVFAALGPSPERVDINDDEAIEVAVRQWFPEAKVMESFSYDWNSDPFSLGTWCWYKPMQTSKYLRALQQPEDRLFFAGADIADGMRGWMDGAVESGIKIGGQLARALGS